MRKNLLKGFLLLLLFAGISCKKMQQTGNDFLPESPLQLTAQLISNTQVILTWIDKSTNEQGFKIERKVGSSNFLVVASTTSDVTTINDSGLSPNTTYTYRVYAFNNKGKSLSYSNEVSITTYSLPNLTTNPISDTTAITAISGGNIISDGGNPIISRGVVWSTETAPTVQLTTKTTDGLGNGQFTSKIEGLRKNTKYYLRAYATNSAGTAYGNELIFTTNDIDISNGLIGYYPFNGNVNDESGNNRHGSLLSGVTLTSGKNAQNNTAYFFNGINGLNSGISLPLSLPAIDYSISLWFQINDTVKVGQNSAQTIICMEPYTTFGVVFNHPYALGKMMSCIGNSKGWSICSNPNPNSWNLNEKLQWHNLTVIKTSLNYKYYIDGVLSRTQDISPEANLVVTKVYLGSYPIASGEVLNGKLDEIRFYNRQLTTQEIKYLSVR